MTVHISIKGYDLPDDIDHRVVHEIWRSGVKGMAFHEVRSFVGRLLTTESHDAAYRGADRVLQVLRKRGAIECRGRRWYATEQP